MVQIVARFSRIPRLYRSAEVGGRSGMNSALPHSFLSQVKFQRQKKTGFKATDTVVDKIIRTHEQAVTVQTGMLTALFSILDVICFLVLSFKHVDDLPIQGATVNFIWNISLSKLYSNCLMSTLNARNSLREVRGQTRSSGRAQQNITLSNSAYAVDGKLARDTLPPNHLGPFGNQEETFVSPENEYGIRMTRVVERV
ncbi:hypothetical protein C8R44DRAFT_753128 [Mycena epipterygia]|nr:hypothetical protein C8R44DRAFT_753128 [Mycena epipterygia]